MGIKFSEKFITANGKRIGVTYTSGPWAPGVDQALIKIRPRRGASLAPLRAFFAIENNSDITTDYFEKDSIRVLPSSLHYAAVKAAAKGRHPVASLDIPEEDGEYDDETEYSPLTGQNAIEAGWDHARDDRKNWVA